MFERQPWMQRAGEYPRSDEEYFGLLVRSIFSAGLGPRVVEARWAGLTQAFMGMVPLAVAGMDESDVMRLLSDPGVIRNRRKIEAAITDAQEFLAVVGQWGSFHDYLRSRAAEKEFAGLVEELSTRFAHLGPTSAALFLFSAGWREDRAADPTADSPGPASATESPGRATRRSKREPVAVGVGSPA